MSRIIRIALVLLSAVTCQSARHKPESSVQAVFRQPSATSISSADQARIARECVREICPSTKDTLTLGQAQKHGDLKVLYDGTYLKPMIDERLDQLFQGRKNFAVLARKSFDASDSLAPKIHRQLEIVFAFFDLIAALDEAVEVFKKSGEESFPITRAKIQKSAISDKSKKVLNAADDRKLLEGFSNVVNRLYTTSLKNFFLDLTNRPKTMEEGLRVVRGVCASSILKITEKIKLPEFALAKTFLNCLADPQFVAKGEGAQHNAYQGMLISMLMSEFLEKGLIPSLSDAEVRGRLKILGNFASAQLPSPKWDDAGERAYCHKKIARNFLYSMTAARVYDSRIKTMVKEVIDAAVVEFGADHPKAEELRQYLQNIPIVSPTEVGAAADIASELNSLTFLTRDLLAGEDPATDLIGVVVIEEMRRIFRPGDVQFNLKETCENINMPLINDSFYGNWNEMDIGQIGALRPEYGYGIFGHEIGHAVSHFIKVNKMAPPAHRRCVNQFHGGSENMEGPYSEEDWADYFSGRVTKRLKASRPELQNFTCLFAKRSPRHGVWAPKLENSPPDPHSNDFFRMVHLHKVLNGTMPGSCAMIMTELKQPNCL